MNKNVEYHVAGLKCDNPNCDYTDMSIKREEYINCIGLPCPKCGESLLTREDYINVLIMEDAVNSVNTLLPDEIEKLTEGISEEDSKKIEHWIVDMYKGIKIIKKGEDTDTGTTEPT